MRSREEKLLNISSYKCYREVLINSADTQIALSIYEGYKEYPCVLFIPGTMIHPLFYDDFLSDLARNKFNVIGIHPISHGKSPRVKRIYSFDDMIENVRDAITYCIDNFNDNVFLMGSSQGGILATAAAGVDSRIKAVLPHNILLPSLSDSIYVTSIPKLFKSVYRLIPLAIKLEARIFPKLQIPPTAYLDLNKVFTVQETKEQYYADPISLKSYPLYFLSSLFCADLTRLTDGSIKCPVIVIASKRDTLFPYDYCCKVFERIKAPYKEMVIFDEPHHLILNECVDIVIERVVKKLNELRTKRIYNA